MEYQFRIQSRLIGQRISSDGIVFQAIITPVGPGKYRGCITTFQEDFFNHRFPGQDPSGIALQGAPFSEVSMFIMTQGLLMDLHAIVDAYEGL
jgi:hypothetical protein